MRVASVLNFSMSRALASSPAVEPSLVAHPSEVASAEDPHQAGRGVFRGAKLFYVEASYP